MFPHCWLILISAVGLRSFAANYRNVISISGRFFLNMFGLSHQDGFSVGVIHLFSRASLTVCQRLRILFFGARLSHSLAPLLLFSCHFLSPFICFFLAAVPKLEVKHADFFDVVVVGAEPDFFAVFFGANMKIVIFIMLFADRAKGMFGVGPRKHLNHL